MTHSFGISNVTDGLKILCATHKNEFRGRVDPKPGIYNLGSTLEIQTCCQRSASSHCNRSHTKEKACEGQVLHL